MEIAIVSDTHMPRGGRSLPGECVERLRAADLILHAGDFFALEVVRQFEAFGPPLRAVHGNVDQPDVRALLPAREVVEAGGARIGMIHDAGPAAGRLERLRRTFFACDAVIFGHSHMPAHEATADGAFQIFNPGSPTERRRAPAHTMGIARIDDAGAIAFELVVVG